MNSSTDKVSADHFCQTVVTNVNNTKLTDAEFRDFIRRTLTIVEFDRPEEGGTPVFLGSEALRTFDILCNVMSSSSPSGHRALRETPESDLPFVMDGLIERMGRHRNWNNRPREFYGAVILAQNDKGCGKKLATFLNDTLAAFPPWLRVLTRDSTWYR